MATVTLEALVYDGQEWSYEDGRKRPVGSLAEALYDMGFRQAKVNSPKYDSKLVLDSPMKSRVEPGSTVVVCDGVAIAVLSGDRTDKPVAKKAAAKKAAKKK